MKNRFIDLLIEKNRKAEEKALNESWSINYDDSDPTKFDPWIFASEISVGCNFLQLPLQCPQYRELNL